MFRRIMASLMGLSLALAATTGYCASVVGIVVNSERKPVQGLRVSALDKTGTVVGGAVSGAKGEYQIQGLADGTYRFALDTRTTIYLKGGPVVANVTAKGLTLNWIVSRTAPPIALAQPGLTSVAAGGHFGMTTLAFSGLVTGVVGAGVLGGLAASGGLGGGGVASPSK
jgi:carboxypeptidase family protein